MPFGIIDDSQKVTLSRKTHVIFDESFPGVGEPPYSMQRDGPDIHPRDKTNLDLLQAGGWTLRPIQHSTSAVVEQTDPTNSTIHASALYMAGNLTEKPIWHAPTDLPGATTGSSPAMATIGGLVIQRQVPAGASWQDTTHAADVAAFPQVQTSSVIPCDRLIVGRTTYNANTGFLVRFYVPASRLHASDILHTYYFGGPFLPSGGGQYGVSVSGDGVAYLNAYMADGSGAYHWYQIAEWRYADPSQAGGSYYNLSIRPINGIYGKGAGIEFRSALSDQARHAGGLFNAYLQKPSDPRVFFFDLRKLSDALYASGMTQMQRRAFKQAVKNAPSASGAGNIRVDSRRDHRGAMQINRLTYPPSALLTDGSFSPEFFPTSDIPFTLSWGSTLPTAPGQAASDCSIVGTLYNADDGTPLALVPGSLTTNSAQFTPVQTASGYFAQFTLTASADQSRAPILWSYKVERDGTIIQDASDEWGAFPQTVSIVGAESDPSHSNAHVTIQDVTNSLPLLRVRSEIPMRIETEFDPADSTKRSVLFRGFTDQVIGTKLGSNATEGISPTSGARQYPSPKWRHYSTEAGGMYTRISTAILLERKSLFDNVAKSPMKVTDVVRAAFGWAGFPSSMVDVPDGPITFFNDPSLPQSMTLNPFTPIMDFIFKSVRDYLGWYCVWDDNSGPILPSGVSQGMWRVIQPPTAPYTPLAAFTEEAPAGKVPSYPGSYPTSPPTSFIPAGCWHEWVKKPEGNAVLVRGITGDALNAVQQWWMNPASYTFDPAHPADRTNPDFLGYVKRIVVGDAGLIGQAAVDFMTNRIIDTACHAIKMGAIENCPNLLITDPNDSKQTRPRPLRFYDPVNVTIDGTTATYLVRNFNPEYTIDSIQYGRLELQAPVQDVQLSGTRWIK